MEDHFVGVAVVGGDDDFVAFFLNVRDEFGETFV